MFKLLKNKTFVNISFQLIGKFFSMALSLINIAVLTRILGQAGYGEYIAVFAYLGIFAMIGNFGLDKILIKELVSLKNKKKQIAVFLGSTLILRFGLIVLASLIAIATAYFLPFSALIKQGILIVSLTYVFNLGVLILVDYFQAVSQFNKSVLIDVVFSKAGQTLLILGFFVLGYQSILLYLSASFLASFLGFVLGFIYIKKYENIKITFKIPLGRQKLMAKKLLIQSFPLAITLFLNQAKKIDIILLSFFSGAQAVGIYGLADRIFENAIIPIALIFSVFFPEIVEKINKKQSLKGFKKIVMALSFFSALLALLLFIFSPLVVKILAGPGFYESVYVIRIFCLAILIQYLITPLVFYLIAKGQQTYIAKSQLLSSVVNIILSLLIIPGFGYKGAALARIVSLFLMLTVLFLALRPQKPKTA